MINYHSGEIEWLTKQHLQYFLKMHHSVVYGFIPKRLNLCLYSSSYRGVTFVCCSVRLNLNCCHEFSYHLDSTWCFLRHGSSSLGSDLLPCYVLGCWGCPASAVFSEGGEWWTSLPLARSHCGRDQLGVCFQFQVEQPQHLLFVWFSYQQRFEDDFWVCVDR